jgi:hypothetical protein
MRTEKNPACKAKPGARSALAVFVLGLSPRRPQAGFDLFHQIGATEL